MKFYLWIGNWLGALCLTACATADTVLQFPDESVGEVSTQPSSDRSFGYSLDGTAWESWDYLGPARGRVRIPDSHQVKLQLNHFGAQDLSWVNALGSHDIAQLSASEVGLDDQGFSKLTRLSGLQHLDVGSNNLTAASADSLAGFTELRYLWLSYMAEVGDELMSAVAKIPNLEQVGIRRTSVTDAGLATLAESRSLRAVYAGRTPITDKGVATLIEMPTIRALRLNSAPEEFRQEGEQYPEITDAVVEALCSRPELELLDLSAARISDKGLARLAGSLKHLRRLVLDHTPITREGLLQLHNFESLEDLRCYQLNGDGSRFDDEVASSLADMKSLKSLRVDLNLSDRGVAALAKLPSLESLTLSGAGITDASMNAIAAMQSLNDLSLQHTRVTDDGYAALAGSSKLRSVQITGNRMTTRCVETLATMPNLTRVGLMTVKPRVDGEPMWKGIEGLDALEQELWLFDCPTLSQEEFAAITRLDLLKMLRIEGGGVLSDAELIHLAECEQLERLSLTNTVVTDSGLAALARLPQLRSLNLSCVATDAGLRDLAQSPSLRRLTVASPNMTDEGFDLVRAANAHIESLRRGEFRLGNNEVSKSKSENDKFWRLGTLKERKELNAMEGEIAPAITAAEWINNEGGSSLADLRGQVVLIDFWGSWCGPCVAQLPEIRRLRDEYAERGLVVLGVHSTSDSSKGKEYIESNNIDWAVALDDSDQTANAYHVPGWPSLYLIDKRGVVRIARPLPDELDDVIQMLLAE